jgi:hypothetical protein
MEKVHLLEIEELEEFNQFWQSIVLKIYIVDLIA